MLYNYDDTIIFYVNICIIYNSRSVLLNKFRHIISGNKKIVINLDGIIIIYKLMYLRGVKLINTSIILY